MQQSSNVGLTRNFINCLSITMMLSALSVGAWSRETEKDYFIKLSVDNKGLASQYLLTNIGFSATSGLAYVSDKYNLTDNIVARFGIGYIALLVTTYNHEAAGHAPRGREFNADIVAIKVNLGGSGSTTLSGIKPYHIQKNNLVSLAGIESNYLLSQKIADSLVRHDQPLDSITGFGYIFSAADKYEYASCHHISDDFSDDINAYKRYTEYVYGDGAMSLSKIKNNAYLDLLDPILIASLYSVFTGNYTSIPKLTLFNTVGLTPFARSVLTPYGIIEKKLGAYIFTDYTPIKVSFSYGTQSKGNNATQLTTFESIALSCKAQTQTPDQTIGLFTGLKNNESVENQTSYSVHVAVFKLFATNTFKLGVEGAFWRQPELFTEDAYRAKTKVGGMLVFTNTFRFNDTIHLAADIGYKTKGFIPGRPTAETPILGASIEWKL